MDFVKFESFVEGLCKGEHDLDGDTFKMYLTNNAPSASDDVNKADLVGLSVANGYDETDIQLTVTNTSGVVSIGATGFTLTGSGAGFGPFRYLVVFNDTHASDALVCYGDRGASTSIAASETYEVTFPDGLCEIS